MVVLDEEKAEDRAAAPELQRELDRHTLSGRVVLEPFCTCFNTTGSLLHRRDDGYDRQQWGMFWAGEKKKPAAQRCGIARAQEILSSSASLPLSVGGGLFFCACRQLHGPDVRGLHGL